MPPPDSSAIDVRPYEARDLDRVRDIFIAWNRHIAASREDIFEAYIARALREEIERIDAYYQAVDGNGFWVAEVDGDVAGMVGIERATDDATAGEVRRMYVDGAYRRRGLGSILLAHAERFCQTTGYQRVVLSTSELQPQAIALYKARGYTQVYEEVADAQTTRAAGGGLRRYYFEKRL